MATPAAPGPSPYGPLADTPDENGFLLPAGFRSRRIVGAGEEVAATGYRFPVFPDGAGTVATDDGGWILVVNSEVFAADAPDAGSVSALTFAADGEVVAARSILVGSRSNCGGSMTPWGTWLSCEEKTPAADGKVWECDPTGATPARERPALGRFHHECAVVDPSTGIVYLTEDSEIGLFRRFTPTRPGDLGDGVLECLRLDGSRAVWVPDGDTGATSFPGSEGLAILDGVLWFDTKYDDRIHRLDLRDQTYSTMWDSDPELVGVERAVLSGVDTIIVDHRTGDLFVAEDGGNMELIVISPDGDVAPFLRLADPAHASSEISGQCFSPDGRRLYVASMRGPVAATVGELVPGIDPDKAGSHGAGVIFEITGPFRGVTDAPPSTSSTSPTTSPATTTATPPSITEPALGSTGSVTVDTTGPSADGTGTSWGLPTAVAVVGGGTAALIAWRARRMALARRRTD